MWPNHALQRTPPSRSCWQSDAAGGGVAELGSLGHFETQHLFMSNDQKPPNKLSAVPGMAVFGCFAVGVIGIIHSFAAVQPGLSLLASALAFGVIVYVSFRT